jgi:hypothetical protein
MRISISFGLIIYNLSSQITPLYSGDWGSFDWLHWMNVFSALPEEYKRVANLVGVRENFIGMMLAKSSNFIHQESVFV